jgi:integrase
LAVRGKQLADGSKVWWITFQWKGKAYWLRSGTDEREARRTDARIKKERTAGTWRPDAAPPKTTVREWFARYLPTRVNRAADGDRQIVRDHVLSRDWFAMLPIRDVRPFDVEKLVTEMRAGGGLSEKYISNIFTVVRAGFKRAVFEELRPDDPCAALPPGTIRRGTSKARQPYSRSEARAVLECASNPLPVRVWLALAFYTGMREGEVCGRRWSDWAREATPLGALQVHTQYEDQPLKSDDLDKARPRYVPVHPNLAAILQLWWSEGFELQFCRPPTLDDFIVPTAGLRCHSRSSAYKAFRRALARAGVPNRSLHSTRHTFISVARAETNRHDLVERITHNAAGTTLDRYTHSEWEGLCEVMMGTDYTRDRNTALSFFQGSDSRTRTPGSDQETPVIPGKALLALGSTSAAETSHFLGKSRVPGAGQDPDRSGWWGPNPPPAVAADFSFLSEPDQLIGGAR